MTATAPAPATFPADWRWHHRHAATSLDEVERLFPGRFDLSRLDRAGIDRAIGLWGMRATPYYLDLAERAAEDDPVWALAVPSPRELDRRAEELDDPIGDEAPGLHPLAGVTRRYRDRALLHPTPTCSVHCRHCFRRRLVGDPDAAVDEAGLDAALAWIAGEPEIHEVVLTGGDPLTLSDARLGDLLARLASMPHVWLLRIHTRMPVVNPFRVTPGLAATLGAVRRPVTVVAHFNHAVEVTPASSDAVALLRGAGVDVLNQSVLLAGLNDDPDTHRELLWALLRARVRPYALHHADLVPGTGHLRTDLATGRRLMRALRGTVPGHGLPQYLLDLPGGHGKVPVDAGFTVAAEGPWAAGGAREAWQVRAPDGTVQRYPPGPGA